MNLSNQPKYTLKHYIRLIFAFYGALMGLSLFQYLIFYSKGVLDHVFSLSSGISLIHHLGYACFIGLLGVPFFNFLEKWRPKFGFKCIRSFLILLIFTETLLIGYYCITYVTLGSELSDSGFLALKPITIDATALGITTVIAAFLFSGLFLLLYRVNQKYYHFLGKMYPLTIVFFGVFIATLFLDGKPLVQNKTQYLVSNLLIKNTISSDTDYFKDSDLVWISSVFGGYNFDKAYKTAVKLAHNKEYEKALLLSKYILHHKPDHIDTKILTARIYGWQKQYKTATVILKNCMQEKPQYSDALLALFDVYFWSEKPELALKLAHQLHPDKKMIVKDKIKRAKTQALQLAKIAVK